MHTTRGFGRAAKRLLNEREEEHRRDGEEGEADGGERRISMRLTRAHAHMEAGLLVPPVAQIEDHVVEGQPTATLSPHSVLQESPIALPIDNSLEAREAMAIDSTSATPNTLSVEEVVGQQITEDMAMEAATIMDGACSLLGTLQESSQPTGPLPSSGAYLGINAPRTIEDGADPATIMKNVALLLSSEWRLACLLSFGHLCHTCML